MSYPLYFETGAIGELTQEYPLGDALLTRFRGMSSDELRALQNSRFLRLMERAWQVPFYQRLWGAAGVEAGDIRGLDDIEKLPIYSKSDLMASVAAYPPIGDFHGLDAYTPETRPSLILHTTSGTTGTPQPLLWGPKSREVQNLLLGRVYRFQGLKAGATIQSCYGHGMINGGHYVREAVLHYTNAMFLSAGTGVETRSAQQVALMKTFGVNVLVGFADYIKRLAEVAKEVGIEPGRDIRIDMISGHLGMEQRDVLSAAWGGAELFDWYGVGDTGAIAAEGPDHDGLYLWEDAQYVEVLDVDTHTPAQRGNMVVTCLFKDDVYPIIRFNTCDVTEVLSLSNSLDLPFRRISGFAGRSDNMVKLRGINIYPQGIGPILEQDPAYGGDYLCVVERDASGRDDMTVYLDTRSGGDSPEVIAARLRSLLKQRLGVELQVAPVAMGSLAPQTGIDNRQKPIRLIDRRGKA